MNSTFGSAMERVIFIAAGAFLLCCWPPRLAGGDVMVGLNASGLNRGPLEPRNILINAGDTVTWLLRSPGANYSIGYGNEWQSPILTNQGQTFSVTLNQAGFFAYRTAGGPGTITVVALTNIAPAVTINSPPDNLYYPSGYTVDIMASVTNLESNIAKVEFFVGTNLLSVATNAPYQVKWNAPPGPAAPAGTYTLLARVIDRAGGSALSRPSVIILTEEWETLIGLPRRLPNGAILFFYSTGIRTCLHRSDQLPFWINRGNVVGSGPFVEESATNLTMRFYQILGCP